MFAWMFEVSAQCSWRSKMRYGLNISAHRVEFSKQATMVFNAVLFMWRQQLLFGLITKWLILSELVTQLIELVNVYTKLWAQLIKSNNIHSIYICFNAVKNTALQCNREQRSVSFIQSKKRNSTEADIQHKWLVDLLNKFCKHIHFKEAVSLFPFSCPLLLYAI